MERINFEKEQIEAVCNEVERRLGESSVYFDNEYALIQERRSMYQGVWSVFCALAANWPDVREWVNDFERMR